MSFKMGNIAIAAAIGVGVIATPTSAAKYSNIFVFGGSYSDAGTYLVDGEQRRWTINPALVWNQDLGAIYGLDVSSFETVDTSTNADDPTIDILGGTNFAQGGARVAKLPGEYSYNVLTVSAQVETYLARSGGLADGNALYTLEGGGNDIFFWAAKLGDAVKAGSPKLHIDLLVVESELQIRLAAKEYAGLAKKLSDAGAKKIVVLSVHDAAKTPVAKNLSDRDKEYLTKSAELFNSTLESQLRDLKLNDIIYIDMFEFLDELINNGSLYGFTNTTDAACAVASAIDCTTKTLKSGASADTYLFSDSVHLSGSGHKALADYVQSLLDAPSAQGQVP